MVLWGLNELLQLKHWNQHLTQYKALIGLLSIIENDLYRFRVFKYLSWISVFWNSISISRLKMTIWERVQLSGHIQMNKIFWIGDWKENFLVYYYFPIVAIFTAMYIFYIIFIYIYCKPNNRFNIPVSITCIFPFLCVSVHVWYSLHDWCVLHTATAMDTSPIKRETWCDRKLCLKTGHELQAELVMVSNHLCWPFPRGLNLKYGHQTGFLAFDWAPVDILWKWMLNFVSAIFEIFIPIVNLLKK